MSGEKTEKATPKRRKEEREKGNILKSIELNSAVVLLFSFLGLKFFGTGMIKNLRLLFTTFYSDVYLNFKDDAVINYQATSIIILKFFILICGPLLLIAFLTGLIINYLQVGFLFLPNMLAFRFNRINPANGFRRLFSMRSAVEMIKSILKMAIVGYVVYDELLKDYSKFNQLIYADIGQSGLIIWDAIMDMAFKAGITLLVLSILDYAYQWWEYEKNMKMSKEEIKEEYKLTEGNPQIKQRVREIQRQLGMRRMMQQVAKADVVITNPVHYAVALLYDEKQNSAPIVVAKGQDYIALKIKEEAQKNKVEIVENKPLAQALYRTTDLGEAIPEELYHAVAEILAAVYRMRNAV